MDQSIFLENIDQIGYEEYVYDMDDAEILVEQGLVSNTLLDSFISDISHNTTENIHIFLKNGYDPNESDIDCISSLMLSVIHCDINVFKLLVEYGGNIDHVDNIGDTILMYACRYRNTEVLNYLLSKGSDVNRGNITYNTALHCIARERTPNIEYATLLLEHGANVNALANLGFTPLYSHLYIDSRRKKSPEFIDLLLRYGANPYITPLNYLSILHVACKQAIGLECMEVFLKYGMDPNIKDHVGDTPLFNVVVSRNKLMIDLLLMYGADPMLRNKCGKTTLEFVMGQNDKEILSIFEKYL